MAIEKETIHEFYIDGKVYKHEVRLTSMGKWNHYYSYFNENNLKLYYIDDGEFYGQMSRVGKQK